MKSSKFLIILFMLLGFVSCKKEGCTDADALNYDQEAKTENNTCNYEGHVSFWHNQSVASTLASYTVTELHVFLNDELIGSITASDWKIGPDCGGANFTVKMTWGDSNPVETYSYEVNDQNGNQQFSGTVSLTANDCKSEELAW